MNVTKKIYKTIKIVVVIVLLLCNFFKLYSRKKILEINNNSSPQPIGKYLYLYKDPQSIYKDSEIVHLSQFQLEQKDVPVMNNVTNGNIWVRFTIINQTNNPALFLSLPYSNISEISFYKRNNKKLEFISTTGNNFNFSERIYKSPEYVFPINLAKGDTSEFFLKIKSIHPILLPLFVKNKDALEGTINNENLVF